MEIGAGFLAAVALLSGFILPQSREPDVLAGFLTVPEPDGISVTVNGLDGDPDGVTFIEDGTAWVPLREVSVAFGATVVVWDPTDMSVYVGSDDTVIETAVGLPYIVSNGRYIYIPETVRLVNGKLMVPARAAARAFNASVTWLGKTVRFTGGGEPLEPGASFYGEEDVYWLSRLIEAEAGGECLEGKIAVGNVVMNRVADETFPDTVGDVIFDCRGAVQFTPAYSGAIFNTPSRDSVIAAKLALDGARPVENCLYFSSAGSGSWASRNRQVYRQIENQMFYV